MQRSCARAAGATGNCLLIPPIELFPTRPALYLGPLYLNIERPRHFILSSPSHDLVTNLMDTPVLPSPTAPPNRIGPERGES